jgi:hypothetical protein
VKEHQIPRDEIRLILNGVDFERFPRRGPLPASPRRALVFSNYADASFVKRVAKACRRTGLTLDAVGIGVGKPVGNPGSVLAEFDIVLAKAKCALEAAAVGAAVVVCDRLMGLGELVTSANVARHRQMHFVPLDGSRELSAGALSAQIRGYDASDAHNVTNWIREQASIETTVDRVVALYEEVLTTFESGSIDIDAEMRDVSRYLRWLSLCVKDPRQRTL